MCAYKLLTSAAVRHQRACFCFVSRNSTPNKALSVVGCDREMRHFEACLSPPRGRVSIPILSGVKRFVVLPADCLHD